MPSYKVMSLCENGVLTAIHSDGYIVDIMEDLISVGMDIINPRFVQWDKNKKGYLRVLYKAG